MGLVGKVAGGFLAALAACASLPAMASDAQSVLSVRIGDGLKELGERVQGLEPDVCTSDEKGWYRSQGWSCEGYAKAGVRVGRVEMRARFRMQEPLFRVVNVVLSGEVAQAAGSEASRLLMDTCDRLMGTLSERYGPGDVSVMNRQPGSVRYVVFYGAKSTAESATMVCQENGATGRGELVVNVEPSAERARPVGVVATR